MRTFLLTLAVVDDLIAVTIIAVFYTSDLSLLPLAATLVPLGLFALLVQKRVRSWWLLLPLAALTWALMHESGVHATVAGVLLGLHRPGDPLAGRPAGPTPGPGWPSTSSTGSGRCRPASPSRCSRSSPPVSRSAGCRAWATRWPTPSRSASCSPWWSASPSGSSARPGWRPASPGRASTRSCRWLDVVGLGLLAGIGFTVSLLIGDLAFGGGGDTDDHVKVGHPARARWSSALLAGRPGQGPGPGLPAHLRGRERRRRPGRHPGRLPALARSHLLGVRRPGVALA